MHGGRAAVCLLLLLATGVAGDDTCDAGECGEDEAALLARKADVQKHGNASYSTGNVCPMAVDVPGPQGKSCSWMRSGNGDNCADDTVGACMCRDYNIYQKHCDSCVNNPCTLHYCFDIVDDGSNSCQWMYNKGDDCTSTDSNAIACRNLNNNLNRCPRPCN
jgi:hypothetical protein